VEELAVGAAEAGADASASTSASADADAAPKHARSFSFERAAWATARRVAEATWAPGMAFRAPEAWDADSGTFRGEGSGAGGAVWAVDHALVAAARRAAARSDGRGARVGDDDAIRTRSPSPRDEL
jgi:non-lysosomal glucosylceramidase